MTSAPRPDRDALDALLAADVIEKQARRHKALTRFITSVVSWLLRTTVLWVALGYLHDQVPPVPALSWPVIAIALLALGTLVGSITEDVLANYRMWREDLS